MYLFLEFKEGERQEKLIVGKVQFSLQSVSLLLRVVLLRRVVSSSEYFTMKLRVQALRDFPD